MARSGFWSPWACALWLTLVYLATTHSRPTEASHQVARTSVASPSNLTRLCYSCLPGSHSTKNCTVLSNNTIEPCNIGFCAVGGETNCTLCSEGTFQPERRQAKCHPCLPGTFAREQGELKCSLCTRGHYCNKTGMTLPFVCPTGFYCPDLGMKSPKYCAEGYTCPTTGMAKPIACQAGFFCRGGSASPSPCPENHFCPAKSGEPLACMWMFQAPSLSSYCSPSAGFIVVLVVVAVSIVVFGIWVWLRLSKRAARKAAQTRSSEITGLIPAPQGPTYSGL